MKSVTDVKAECPRAGWMVASTARPLAVQLQVSTRTLATGSSATIHPAFTLGSLPATSDLAAGKKIKNSSPQINVIKLIFAQK